MTEKSTRTPVSQDDMKTMRKYARRLAKEPNPNVRMSIQMQFVKELGAIYGHEKACRLLTKVWLMAKSAEYASA